VSLEVAAEKENSEAIDNQIGAPASGITAVRQVLTPRTKICKPVLGLDHIASLHCYLLQKAIPIKEKLFTFIHNWQSGLGDVLSTWHGLG
jgi:hypothetical protein